MVILFFYFYCTCVLFSATITGAVFQLGNYADRRNQQVFSSLPVWFSNYIFLQQILCLYDTCFD